MTDWYCRNLGDALMAHADLGRIEQRFRADHMSAGCPSNMALFIRHVSEGQLHCDVILYFTPAAAGLAAWAEAEACPPPDTAGLGLFVGPEEAWSALFLG